MSLPFLKHKPVAGLIIAHRKPDGAGIQESHTDGQENDGMEACMEDMMRASKAGDAKAYATAFRAAIQILNTEPGESNDFDAQNEKAAQES